MCFGPRTIIRELYRPCYSYTIKSHINFAVPVGYCGNMLCCVMLCCGECRATDVPTLIRNRALFATQHNTACYHNTQLE